MAKDYFQDIIPSQDDNGRDMRLRDISTPQRDSENTNRTKRPGPGAPRSLHIEHQQTDGDESSSPRILSQGDYVPPKSIRNITSDLPHPFARDRVPLPRLRSSRRGRTGMWIAGIVMIVVLASVLGVYFYESSKPSVITVSRHTQTMLFGGTAITAYPKTIGSASSTDV